MRKPQMRFCKMDAFAGLSQAGRRAAVESALLDMHARGIMLRVEGDASDDWWQLAPESSVDKRRTFGSMLTAYHRKWVAAREATDARKTR